MAETLSQSQIIQSLADALSWFEKELAWGVSPSELRHLTGRIGELYAAMVTRGQMALATNQKGYDVVSADNRRISVKTITSSNHVSFNPDTFDHVDWVIVLRINLDDDEGLSIEEVIDQSAKEVKKQASFRSGKMRIPISKRNTASQSLGIGKITNSAVFGDLKINRHENGTIKVEQNGVDMDPAKPFLRDIAAKIGVDIYYGDGKLKNTRQLGSHVIKAVQDRHS